MPEMPEVETIRRDVIKKALRKTVDSLEINYAKIVKSPIQIFKKALIGNQFKSIDRIGKLLIVKIDKSPYYLLLHLKMTGQIIYRKQNRLLIGGHSNGIRDKDVEINSLPNKHTHVIFNFSDGSKFFFNDMRKFGYLKIVNEDELKKIKEQYGIEPLTKKFTFENLKSVLKNRKTNIKAVLLNQKLVSGLGNIYVDEVLFKSKILPNRPAQYLKEQEIKAIIENANQIILKAIKYRGTTFSNYMDASGRKGNYSQFLRVFGHQGEKCSDCGQGLVTKIKIAGRGTHFCSKCQV